MQVVYRLENKFDVAVPVGVAGTDDLRDAGRDVLVGEGGVDVLNVVDSLGRRNH